LYLLLCRWFLLLMQVLTVATPVRLIVPELGGQAVAGPCLKQLCHHRGC
jgi:hypothetical protein